MTINEVEDLLGEGGWFRRFLRVIASRGDPAVPLLLRGPPRSPEEGVARTQLRLRAIDAVMVLEEPLRSIVALRIFERCSYPEIATLAKAPDEVVRVHLRRGLARARATLRAPTSRGIKPPDGHKPQANGSIRA